MFYVNKNVVCKVFGIAVCITNSLHFIIIELSAEKQAYSLMKFLKHCGIVEVKSKRAWVSKGINSVRHCNPNWANLNEKKKKKLI